MNMVFCEGHVQFVESEIDWDLWTASRTIAGGELVDADTRLIVLQDRAVDAAYPWLMNVWTHSFETHFSNAVPDDFSCAHNRGSPSNDLFILNHFLTAVFGAPELAEMVNHDPLLSDRILECEAFQSTVANFVTVDFVEIGDVFTAVAQ